MLHRNNMKIKELVTFITFHLGEGSEPPRFFQFTYGSKQEPAKSQTIYDCASATSKPGYPHLNSWQILNNATAAEEKSHCATLLLPHMNAYYFS